MPGRSFHGATSVTAAVAASLAPALAVCVGGFWIAQRWQLPPAAVVGVLLLSCLTFVLIYRALGTKATWTIEDDALVQTRRGRVRRVPWRQVLYAHYSPGVSATPAPHVELLLHNGARLTLWSPTVEGAELRSFFDDMSRLLPAEALRR